MMKTKINPWATTNAAVNRLWNNGQPNRAALAGLRTAKTISDHQAVVAWPILLDVIPEDSLSITGKPTKVEKAVFTATKAYALYQQGTNDRCLNDSKGQSIMQALAQLRTSNPDQADALDRRIENLLSTRSVESLTHQLLSLILILKSRRTGQPLSFGRMAQDLFSFQIHTGAYNGAHRTILQWGREYYAAPVVKNTPDAQN